MTQLQIDCVSRWHNEPVGVLPEDLIIARDTGDLEIQDADKPSQKAASQQTAGIPGSAGVCDSPAFEALVCRQHEFNFRLWHEEDIARSPDVTDTRIAEVKRSIDGLNQQRNDWIERIDDAISEILGQLPVPANPKAKLNTETPGSAIDRLSIMSLRLYHYAEQQSRPDVDEEHREKVDQRIRLCRHQHEDLSNSLQELLDAIFAGRKVHRTYRQMKMYNDPSLNPAIYRKG